MAEFNALIGEGTQHLAWWQMSIRGALILLYGLILIRCLGRRAFGQQSPLDIVLAIVIGSSLSRTVTGNAPFLPTLAAMAIMTGLFWLLEHLAARSHAFSWLVKGGPIVLAHDGELDHRTMRRAGVSRGDIEEAARIRGVGWEKLQEAVLERNGKISALPRSQ
ncbi:MAG TPA: YetF domain-containing protein [Stellaceae bacterium]|nr:YetF domain-containing protein [Stellaceae bacterium]